MPKLLGLTITGKEVYDVDHFTTPADWMALDHHSAGGLYAQHSDLPNSRWDEISSSHFREYHKLVEHQLNIIIPPNPVTKDSIWEFLVLNDIERLQYKSPKGGVINYWRHGISIISAPKISGRTNKEVFREAENKFGYQLNRP
jgi:hypothetical protein